MEKNIQYFTDNFNKQFNIILKQRTGFSIYGDSIIPFIREYKELTSYNERISFNDSLELLLQDPDEKKRKFAVLICLGFVTFRDSV